MPDPGRAEQQTRRWLEEFVVGLNLCPFARPLLASEQLRVTTCTSGDDANLQVFFLKELFSKCEKSDKRNRGTSIVKLLIVFLKNNAILLRL